jgi:DNA-binding SARP family transcriptional activator
MQYRILGPLEATDADGTPLPIGGRKQRALLAVLLLRANEVVSTDKLIDELWGEDPPGTAANTVQVHVSNLRRALGSREAILTRPPGYVLRVERDELDLERFVALAEEGRRALSEGRADEASDKLRSALDLWRGPALSDLEFEPFAHSAVLRLEELRLVAREDRIEADLACGRHAEVIPELEALIAEHPLRERQRGQLMLARYRSGRQAEALDAYQAARHTLVEELGIEPSPALQRLEKAILTHDSSLDLPAIESPARVPATPGTRRSILVVPQHDGGLGALAGLAGGLARSDAAHELIIVRLAQGGSSTDLAAATALLAEHRGKLEQEGVAARTAAFTSRDAARDIVRLATQQDIDLLLVDAPAATIAAGLDDELTTVLVEAPCDVAVLVQRDGTPGLLRVEGPVVVPFGGAEHDWAALELGAWVAGSFGARLLLAGAESDEAEARDASWLLANASLVVQQFAGVPSEPLLVPPGSDGLLQAAEGAAFVLVGLTDRWRSDGVGPSRTALAERASAPVALVRRGLRPSGLAPRGTLTRFTWSLAGAGVGR